MCDKTAQAKLTTERTTEDVCLTWANFPHVTNVIISLVHARQAVLRPTDQVLKTG